MKILHEKFVKITAGEFQGKIFRLNHYQKRLQVADFPGPPPQLISIDDLQLVNMPFPYWRTEGEGMMMWTYQPSSTRCDTLSIGEQISLCANRILMLKPSMKLHENKLKKEILKAGRGKLKNDNLYCFLQREVTLEMKLVDLLKDIIPVTAPDKNIIQKLEREYITKNPHKIAGGNIANASTTRKTNISSRD